MSKDLNIKIGVNLKEVAKLDNIAAKFKETQRATRLTTGEARKYLDALNQTARAEGRSINNLKDLARGYRQLAGNIDKTSQEYREATREAAKFERQAGRASRGRMGRGLRGGFGLGAAAGAASRLLPAAAGTTAAGAGIGALGGPLGIAIGATVGAAVAVGGPAAEYAAQMQKLRIALVGVTTSQEEYEKGLSVVAKSSEDLAIPQDTLLRQFTRLQASVQGAGGDLNQTETAFNAIVSAVRATGGSLTDVDAALTATAQVFSKGKVSAEELRQQLGERLPGAFTLFAESIGKTPQELDKALEKGEVTLEDFMKFAESLMDRYGDIAKRIADDPAAAGDRLQKNLRDLSESMGTLLQPIGAAFQDIFSEIVKAINGAIKALNAFFKLGEQGLVTNIEQLSKEIDRQLEIAEALGDASPSGRTARATASRLFEERSDLMVKLRKLRLGATTQPEAKGGLPGGDSDPETDKVKNILPAELQLRRELIALKQQGNLFDAESKRFELEVFQIKQQNLGPELEAAKLEEARFRNGQKIGKIIEGRIDLIHDEERALFKVGQQLGRNVDEGEKIKGAFEKIGDTIKNNIVDGLTEAIVKGKSLGEVLSNILRQAASLFVNFGLTQIFPFLKVNAMGNVYDKSGFVPFAKGGVVNSPTLFPFKDGIGLMGEAGSEAIMPLRRGPSGRLGVEASGGMGGNVVVNVDASGSSVEGDSQGADQLGKVIGLAVQNELVKQKRPGGLLA